MIDSKLLLIVNLMLVSTELRESISFVWQLTQKNCIVINYSDEENKESTTRVLNEIRVLLSDQRNEMKLFTRRHCDESGIPTSPGFTTQPLENTIHRK